MITAHKVERPVDLDRHLAALDAYHRIEGVSLRSEHLLAGFEAERLERPDDMTLQVGGFTLRLREKSRVAPLGERQR